MAKAILLVRVSTERQDYEEQRNQLIEMAIKDGYTVDDIISICEKESGFKSEDERLGLTRMKQEIERGGVDCVYVWEISRLARNPKISFSISDYFEEHKINLKSKLEGFSLCNDNGKIDLSAKMSYAMLVLFAQNEMQVKKDRFKRTTKEKANNGKFNGGIYTKYGYAVDANGYYIINDDEAKIVKLIYELYTSTDMGATMLRNELASRGIKLTVEKIRRILYTQGYDGTPYIVKSHIKDSLGNQMEGNTIKYPQIIPTELWNKACKKRNTNSNYAHRNENYYFAKNLIRCPKCGCIFIASKNIGAYVCGKHNQGTKFDDPCDNRTTVKIDYLDAILWYVARFEYSLYLTNLKEKNTEDIIKQIEVLEQKHKACVNEIKESEKRLDKIAEMYVEGIWSKDRKDKEIAKVKSINAENEKKIKAYEMEIEKAHNLLHSISNSDEYIDFVNSDLSADLIESRKKIYEIIRMFITSIEVNQMTEKREKHIVINLVDGKKQDFKLRYRGRNWEVYEIINEKEYEITSKVQIIPRVSATQKTK